MARRRSTERPTDGSRVRVDLIVRYRALVAADWAYAYAPAVGWGETLDALVAGRPVTVAGWELAAVGLDIDVADHFSRYLLDSDDRITLAHRSRNADRPV